MDPWKKLLMLVMLSLTVITRDAARVSRGALPLPTRNRFFTLPSPQLGQASSGVSSLLKTIPKNWSGAASETGFWSLDLRYLFVLNIPC